MNSGPRDSLPTFGDRVAVIVVNYNGGKCLQRCLEALAIQTRKPDRCLLVDNHSQLEPVFGDEPWLQGIEFLQAEQNLGFAAANNLAIRHCHDVRWVALLNPDTEPAPNWLEKLLSAAAAHPDHGSFASKQLDMSRPSRLDGAGDGLTRAGRPYRRGYGQPSASNYKENDAAFSACAAAALYRRDNFLAAGGFDEMFFCYLEDVDLGFRLQLVGLPCLYVADAVVRHAGSALTGYRSDFATYHGHRNLVWLYVKNMPTLLLILYLPWHLVLTAAAGIRCLRRGQGVIFWKAKRDALLSLSAAISQRPAVQSTRRTSILKLWCVLTGGL